MVAGGILVIAVVVLVIRNMLLPGLSGMFGQGAKATLGDQTINLEVAKTPEEQQIGLSEHTTLAENQGMIFTYEKPGYYSFWMRDMKFPIDIIFLDGEKIVTVHKNVQPPTDKNASLPLYTSEQPANRVLETKAGLAEEYDLKKGDTIDLTL